MKYFFKCVLITIMMPMFHNAYSQELIHNRSFEDVKSGEDPASPFTPHQVDNMQVWEDDMSAIGSPPCFYLHSPDWYKDSGGHDRLQYCCVNNSNAFIPIPAHSGAGYVGMFDAELIEQKFFDSDPLLPGLKYTMSMYVMIFPPYTQDLTAGEFFVPDASILPTSRIHLKIFLASQKIKYKDRGYTCEYLESNFYSVFSQDFEDGFDEKKVISNNIIDEVKDITLDINSYPMGQWHKVSFTFTAPIVPFEWIAIEEASKSSPDPDYTYYIGIDDVSLMRTCELSCYPTSGEPNPVVTSGDCPLVVSNLNNVSTAHVVVTTSIGQTPIWSTTVYGYNNGITNPIIWNGFTSNGAIPATAAYEATVTCTNDCGTWPSKSYTIFGGNTCTTASNNNYPNGPKVPNPCCLYDLTIQNQTLNGNLLYSVGHDITAGPAVAVPSGSNVTFEAGNAIHLLPGFHAQTGSVFHASIVPCPGFRMENPNEEDSSEPQDYNSYYVPDNSISKATHPSKNNDAPLDSLQIQPNPTFGTVKIIVQLPPQQQQKEQKYHITIYNMLGQQVYHEISYSPQNIINLTGQPTGIYLVKVEAGGQTFYKKVMLEK